MPWNWLRSRRRRPEPLFTTATTPPHESPLRRMVSDAGGGSYEAFRSLAEARGHADATLVMQGDDGGSIYLTCPVRLVRCDEAALEILLMDLDKQDWNEPDMAAFFYERASIGSGIVGGTGGGIVVEGVWLHPNLVAKGLQEPVEAVIAGRRSRI